MKLPTIIETERLTIYPLEVKHTQDIYNNFNKEINTFMTSAPPKKLSDTEEFVSGAIKKNQDSKDFHVVFFNREGEFIGGGSLSHIDTSTPEFGVWVKKSAHGNKYGREAMTALKLWADQNIEYEYLKYPVAIQNIASRKIPESLGGIVKDEYKRMRRQTGKFLNCVEYRIYPE